MRAVRPMRGHPRSRRRPPPRTVTPSRRARAPARRRIRSSLPPPAPMRRSASGGAAPPEARASACRRLHDALEGCRLAAPLCALASSSRGSLLAATDMEGTSASSAAASNTWRRRRWRRTRAPATRLASTPSTHTSRAATPTAPSAWRLADLHCLRSFHAHASPISSLDWADGGSALLTSARSAAAAPHACVWSAADGRLLESASDGAQLVDTAAGGGGGADEPAAPASHALADGSLLAGHGTRTPARLAGVRAPTPRRPHSPASRRPAARRAAEACRAAGGRTAGSDLVAVAPDNSLHVAPFAPVGVLHHATRAEPPATHDTRATRRLACQPRRAHRLLHDGRGGRRSPRARRHILVVYRLATTYAATATAGGGGETAAGGGVRAARALPAEPSRPPSAASTMALVHAPASLHAASATTAGGAGGDVAIGSGAASVSTRIGAAVVCASTRRTTRPSVRSPSILRAA